MIKITLEQTAVTPGDSISGAAEWQSEKPVKEVFIRLFWHTLGIGDKDTEIIDERVTTTQQTFGSQTFEFSVPSQPYSFRGKLITLQWGIEIVVEPSGESAHQTFVVGPEQRAIELHA